MNTLMMVLGGFSLVFGITRIVMLFAGPGTTKVELTGPTKSEGVILTMIMLVFGLFVFGFGLIWTLAGDLAPG